MSHPKRQILFVDDNPQVLRGFKRSLEEYSDEWDMFFAGSGREALQALAVRPMDVLVTDMSMPGMDGNQLLEQVSAQYPGVIRIVLSGNVDDSQMYQTARLAHQMIPKPCNLEHLHSIIQRSCRLRDTLSDPRLVHLTTGIRNLPSLPSLYLRLMRLLQSEDPTPNAVGDVIAQDVGMTAKILQLVNSAFFGLYSQVTSPHKAVMLLGINTIKALTLGIQVFSDAQGWAGRSVAIEPLWQHSLMVSSVARAIAIDSGLTRQEQEDAQVAGVLHDVGKLLLLRMPGFSPPTSLLGGVPALGAEYQKYGASHAELGAYLLGIWGLPEPIVEVAAFHHRLHKVTTDGINIVAAVHIADSLYYFNRDLSSGRLDKKAPASADIAKYLNPDWLKIHGPPTQLERWAVYSASLASASK